MSGNAVDGRGLLMVNLAVALFGLSGVLGAMTALPSLLIVLGRTVFGGIALLALARLQGMPLVVPRAGLAALAGQGLLLAVHWTSFFQSIAVSNVAIGLLSFATFPLFTALLEPRLLGTRLSRPQLAGAVAILAGIYVLVPELSLESAGTQGVLWGLLGAATFALLAVLNRRLGATYPGLLISLYQNAVAAVLLLPALFVVNVEALWQPRVLVILLVLGVCCTAVAHTLFIAGLQHMTAQLASLLGTLEPVWGIMFGVLLLGEVPEARAYLGGAIIVGATSLPTLLALRSASGARSE